VSNYEILEGGNVPVYSWTKGVPFEPGAKLQLLQTALLSFIHKHIAVMPDVHFGRGSTVGSVIPTIKAIVPAMVGVDIGCGVISIQTSLTADKLQDKADQLLYDHISKVLPVGSADKAREGQWGKTPGYVNNAWEKLKPDFDGIVGRHGRSKIAPVVEQLGTLGGGNHFVSINLDQDDNVWILIHSGSRGVGNKIGSHFIELAKKDMERLGVRLPNKDLAYFEEDAEHFNDYVNAVDWCQEYARVNRELILRTVIDAMRKSGIPKFTLKGEVINNHHNYIRKEEHFGEQVWITRKGAISARQDELGIIPGAMSGFSYIVKGKGNPDSFCSCSHGAGRVMSRGDAKRSITLAQHKEATSGTICRQDSGVLDESPAAYKDINAVMAAQSDLVDIVYTLKEIVNIKG
jgi:tRNA-splicing ligase RtcB